MFLLVGALFPVLDGLAGYADAYTSGSIAEGVAMELNSLRPGLSFVLYLASAPPGSVIHLHGHYVVADAGTASTSIRVGPLLPDLTLVPGEDYLVSLNGSAAEVSPVVRN